MSTRVLRRRESRFADDAVVVCVTGLATHNDAVAVGDRRRGSDETVRAHPGAFVLDGTPRSEWPVHEIAVPEPEPEFTARARPTPRVIVDGVVVCSTSFMTKAGGQMKGGTVLHADDPLVAAHPEFFSPFSVPDPNR